MAQPATIREQRRHRRLPASIRVFARRPGVLFSDPAIDISLGGIQVSTPTPLPAGTESVFALQLPHHDVPLELQGRVVWSRAGAMGIAFAKTEPRLASFVDRLERDSTRY